MHLIVRRYNRSDAAPMWFYAALAIGFSAMAIWAFARTDWVVGAVAVCMVPATIAVSRLMRRTKGALRASSTRFGSKGDHR